MYIIEGDGSYQKTTVWKDGKKIPYETCQFWINEHECQAEVDGVEGKLDRAIISAIYLIISDGDYRNSRVIVNDTPLRGVQGIIGLIQSDDHPLLIIETILMPNIVEEKKNV